MRDDQLRMIFTCCHPALSPLARTCSPASAVPQHGREYQPPADRPGDDSFLRAGIDYHAVRCRHHVNRFALLGPVEAFAEALADEREIASAEDEYHQRGAA
ncbi:hypothetical protein [Acrocarpospora sp. B8E8]|uniref:hypothetical protein n=1 Tax=Acrocarpospora sp. B8E8 TaxID=3153572 RepID=UPI00325D5CF6